MRTRTPQSTQLACNDAPTALGRVTLAGFIYDGLGVQATRVLGSYALVYLLEGGGWYRDATPRTIRLRAGDLLMIHPNIGHTYGPEPAERWSEYYCVFDGPAFDLLHDIGLLAARRTVAHLSAIDAWLSRLEAALPSQAAVTLSERTVALSRFIQLVTEIAALAADDAGPVAPGWIGEACRLLRAHLDRALPPANVAAALGVPYETFRKTFQRMIGVSPGRYRMIRRIDAACAMLLETDLAIYLVAERLGFANEFIFSRRFKQITGMAPREYRRQLPRLRRHSNAAGDQDEA